MIFCSFIHFMELYITSLAEWHEWLDLNIIQTQDLQNGSKVPKRKKHG
jgi:hypothetical protein